MGVRRRARIVRASGGHRLLVSVTCADVHAASSAALLQPEFGIQSLDDQRCRLEPGQRLVRIAIGQREHRSVARMFALRSRRAVVRRTHA